MRLSIDGGDQLARRSLHDEQVVTRQGLNEIIASITFEYDVDDRLSLSRLPTARAWER